MPTHRLSFPSAREHPLEPPLVQTELRETCPVVAVDLHDGQPAWLVTRYDDIRTVLSDDRFSSAELWRFAGSANRAAAERAETSFTVMDPPDHTHYRRLFTRYFTIKRVETLRPRIQAIVDEAVDALLATPGPGDLVRDLALPIASQTMCALVGVPYADHEWYEERAEVRSQMDGDPAESERAFQDLLAYMSGLVDQAHGGSGDDTITASVRDLLEPGLIDQADLVAALRLLLTAGHETTATMIATGAYVLLTHPDQLDELR
ncbi:MAG: cytochrome P450, partial [Lapillicoccus sp.]